MEINDIISNLIAVAALLVAWSAKRRADHAFEINAALQERLEAYNHFPIVSLRLESSGQRIRLVIINSSAHNPIREYKVSYVLRIWAGNNTYNVNREDIRQAGEGISPNSEEEVSSTEINAIVDNSIPFLRNYPPEECHFVLKAIVTCYPPHPDSPKIIKEVTEFFIFDSDSLCLKPRGDNKIAHAGSVEPT